MIKIIQVDSFSGLGGGQKVMFEIIKGLRTEFDFLVAAPPGLFLEKYSKLGVKFHQLKRKNLFDTVKELRNLIKKEKPEILHLHGTRAATWGRLAVIGLRNKPQIIYTLHGFHLPRRDFFVRWFLLGLERFLNQWTDVLICVSEADKNLVKKYKTISFPKIKVIKNGIDIDKFQISQEGIEKTKKELKLEDNFILCSVGRLHPPKDVSTILRGLKLVISEIPNLKLLTVGDGPFRDSLERETKGLGLKKYVDFLGFREDIPTLINLSDIIILSTRWEGLPLAPLEAGASKKPIIASDVEGVREAVIDGKTGYLFSPGSEKDLAEKILELTKSKELRERMGENGLEFVSKNFSKERMIKEYQKLYQLIL